MGMWCNGNTQHFDCCVSDSNSDIPAKPTRAKYLFQFLRLVLCISLKNDLDIFILQYEQTAIFVHSYCNMNNYA